MLTPSAAVLADGDCHAIFSQFSAINVEKLPVLLSEIMAESRTLAHHPSALSTAASVFVPRNPTANAGFLLLEIDPRAIWWLLGKLSK